MFATSNHPPPISHSPTFNFHHHPNAAYQMNAPIAMHNPHGPSLTEDSMVNANCQAAQQQPAHFVPSQQPWASNMNMQYEGMQQSPSNLGHQYNGHGSNPYSSHGGWQMQQFRMHHQPQVVLESPVVP
eukprot:jgi/Psemu1/305540/fgenesh1_kg.203_\